MSSSDVQTANAAGSETGMKDDLIIEAVGVQKFYHTGQVSVPALRGVDLRVRRGEMVAVMGPSGCGKTTLLNCLSGLDTADQGQIAIEGVSLSEMSDYERTAYRARRMGFVFQFYNLLPVLSAVENVELPLLVSGVRLGEARKRALEALEQVGLAQRAYHRPAALSGGERQRTTIARALVNRPALVWADEPTGDLDSETASEIMDLLLELNHEQHLTFILVTHDRGIGARCERIVRMRDGLVVGEEAQQEVASRQEVASQQELRAQQEVAGQQEVASQQEAAAQQELRAEQKVAGAEDTAEPEK